MKTLLKKSAILKTISSKISTYLHAIDADPQEDDSDFDDEEWMECPTKPTLAHIDGSTLGILALCRHRTDKRRICFHLDKCVLRLLFWVGGM